MQFQSFINTPLIQMDLPSFIRNAKVGQLGSLVAVTVNKGQSYIENDMLSAPSSDGQGQALMPKMDATTVTALIAYVILDIPGNMNYQRQQLLLSWEQALRHALSIPDPANVTSADKAAATNLLGKVLEELRKVTDFPCQNTHVLISDFNTAHWSSPDMLDRTSCVFDPDYVLQAIHGHFSTAQPAPIEEGLVLKTIAALGANGLLLGPPGTGKTWTVQKSLDLPVIQVSLEGSTEPETVVANIAQNTEGRFQSFLAEIGKALKLSMLLAIVERLRDEDSLTGVFDANVSETTSTIPDFLQRFAPAKKAGYSKEFQTIVESLQLALVSGEESQVWLSVLDNYADPFEIERWTEVVDLYVALGANKVGTTVILSVEEIYHAVENRKILDLLINLMAGQKRLPLTKAGVVGGDLFGHNVSFWATGNPLRDAYLPDALSSRFGFQQFVGYPDAAEEQRRMSLAIDAVENPAPMELNLVSTRLSDFGSVRPLARPSLTAVSEAIRKVLYKVAAYTRQQCNDGNLRAGACPRMTAFWEVLTAALLAQGMTAREAVMSAIDATSMAIVDLDHRACPDNSQIITLKQYAESIAREL